MGITFRNKNIIVMGIDIKACLGELLGTFALCYVGGCSGPYLLNAAVAHGFVLGFMIYAGANTSGSNFNPAVSLGLAITGNLDFISMLLYTAFQLLGGFLAGLMVAWVNGNCGCPATNTHFVNQVQAFLCELWATFFLAIAVYGTAVDKRAAKGVFGLAIGGSLTMSVVGIGSYTGAALNPARYFGPRLGAMLITGHWMNFNGAHVVDNQSGYEFWIYLAGPYAGAVAAMILYKFLFFEQPTEVEVEIEAELEI